MYQTGETEPLTSPPSKKCIGQGRGRCARGGAADGCSRSRTAIVEQRHDRRHRARMYCTITPRPNEFKVDGATGNVKPTHGVSVFDNPTSVSSKGFTPHRVDQSTVPENLQIIQRGRDPAHFDITPKPDANLTPEQFIDACSGIKYTN